MTLTIARARVDEVDAIRRVLSETWTATYADHLSRSTIEQVTTHWHAPALLCSQIEKPGDYFGVAKYEGTIIGLITVAAAKRDELFLPRLYVHPGHQRKGVGTGLLNAAIAMYPDARLIRLEVEERNANGRSYWRHQNFIDMGTSFQQIGNDRIEVITMERRLK
jgi:ribosomal protein S18 acetylase RimI-like enzyme